MKHLRQLSYTHKNFAFAHDSGGLSSRLNSYISLGTAGCGEIAWQIRLLIYILRQEAESDSEACGPTIQ